MDSAKRQLQLQILREQRMEADAKTRRLQLEEQMERCEQVQKPMQDGGGQAPVWSMPWQYPPPGAAFGTGQHVHQWHQSQQGPVSVWVPMQGPASVQAVPVQFMQGGQYLGSSAASTVQQQFAQPPPAFCRRTAGHVGEGPAG